MQKLSALAFLSLLSSFAFADDFPAIRNTQAEGEHPPSPREMLDLFELPEGFNVTLFAGEPDVQQPIAFDFDDYGRIWVAENYTYSARAKIDQVMRDRVIILHDKDGDGEHDERKVFWDQGRMLTGLTWGYGGLWILNDGTLSFIPDKDGDDVPDSEPVPMLNGWTKGAGHNVVNGLLWGPDGWLYGRHGITDTSYPGTIDTPKEERRPMNCGIWRFHPVKHTFEIVCHGTTNPWGLDYNEVGDMFMSNNVIGHLWHVIPGAHYQRMFGQDFNPHCYELMGPISDHYHWDDTGKWSQSRDGAADHLGGGHSHCGLMLYYGQNFPKEYWGKAFMCNTHGRCVNVDRIERKGSSYVAKHEPNFLKVNTPWFRGVELKYGPNGCVYLSDWSDNGECHDHDGVHRTSGRIYRISYGEVHYADSKLDLSKLASSSLITATSWDKPEWHRRRAARRFIEQYPAASEHEKKESLSLRSWSLQTLDASNLDDVRSFHIFAAANLLDGSHLTRAILSRNPFIRAAAVRYSAQDHKRFSTLAPVLGSWVLHEDSPSVWLAFASALQRSDLTNKERTGFDILFGLNDPTRRKIIDDDPTLRLQFWYGFERAAKERPSVFRHTLLLNSQLAGFRMRRMAENWNEEAEFIDRLFDLKSDEIERKINHRKPTDVVVGEMRELLDAAIIGSAGQLHLTKLDHWDEVLDRIRRTGRDELTLRLSQLDARMGNTAAISEMIKLVGNRSGDHSARSQAIHSLANVKDRSAVPVFLPLLNDRAVYVDICKALAAFDDDPRIPTELLKRWSGLRHGAKEAATDTLCSRKSYAVEFTKAIADGRVDPGILTAAQVRQLNAFNDESITAIVDKHWGVINETPEALEASIAKWKQELTEDVLAKADLTNGAALFKKSCATCHKLYGEGGKIGPDLTGGNRANMDYLLSNVINPSGEVPKQYTVSVIALKSGRLVNGVIVAETEQTLTVQTDKEQIVVAKADVEERTRTPKSLMPDGLLDNLTSNDVRDLIGFVRKRR